MFAIATASRSANSVTWRSAAGDSGRPPAANTPSPPQARAPTRTGTTTAAVSP
jgi:hypothetical protein